MANRFGSLDLDNHNVILQTNPEILGNKIGQTDAAGRDGGMSSRGFRSPVDFTLGGIIEATGTVNIIDLWRDFVSQLNPYAPQKLQLDYFGSRYIYAQCTGVREVQAQPAYLSARGFEADFYCADPFWYSTTDKSASLGTSGVTTLAVGGRAYAAPAITLVASGVTGPTPGTAVLIDDFGESFYVGFDSAGTVTVDSRLGQVLAGTAYREQWDGVFPLLNPGSPTLNLQPGPVQITQASATWTDRD
jgi:hypothetical protein